MHISTNAVYQQHKMFFSVGISHNNNTIPYKLDNTGYFIFQ